MKSIKTYPLRSPFKQASEAKLKNEVVDLKDKLAKLTQRKAASQAAAKPKQPVKPKVAVKAAVVPKAMEAARLVKKARRVARAKAAAPAGQATVATVTKDTKRPAPRSRNEAAPVAAEPAGGEIGPAAEGASGGS